MAPRAQMKEQERKRSISRSKTNKDPHGLMQGKHYLPKVPTYAVLAHEINLKTTGLVNVRPGVYI
jgi:hypothetical protein